MSASSVAASCSVELSAGVDSDLRDEGGRTLLILAASRDRLAAVQLLLSAGAEPQLTDRYGDCALTIAAREAGAGVVRALLRGGAQPDVADGLGQTPLMIAARRGRAPTVKVLLAAGADPNVTDAEGRRALGLAHRADHYPRQLSGGEEQRAAIARAIVTDPRIIVADEPTGDLDAVGAIEILELLRELGRRFEKTLIMVTHDHAAAAVADRTLHLHEGALRDGPLPVDRTFAAGGSADD